MLLWLLEIKVGDDYFLPPICIPLSVVGHTHTHACMHCDYSIRKHTSVFVEMIWVCVDSQVRIHVVGCVCCVHQYISLQQSCTSHVVYLCAPVCVYNVQYQLWIYTCRGRRWLTIMPSYNFPKWSTNELLSTASWKPSWLYSMHIHDWGVWGVYWPREKYLHLWSWM